MKHPPRANTDWPRFPAQFNAYIKDREALNVTHTTSIFRIQSGTLLKWAYYDLADEVETMKFAYHRLRIPVPRVIHHPPSAPCKRRQHVYLDTPYRRVWYVVMDECPGVSLEKVIDTMSPVELEHIASQLSEILLQMASVKPGRLGTVRGGPYRNDFWPEYLEPKYPFDTCGEFLDAYREVFRIGGCTDAFIEKIISPLPRNAPIRFTHGDLIPQNIMVNGSTITGIIDWGMGGFYPSYWEYARMHNPGFVTPGWSQVLARIFPGEKRNAEIRGVRGILSAFSSTFGCI